MPGGLGRPGRAVVNSFQGSGFARLESTNRLSLPTNQRLWTVTGRKIISRNEKCVSISDSEKRIVKVGSR